MQNLNITIVAGYVGQDPRLRFTAGGTAVANFSLATSENWKDRGGEWKKKTTWHNIVVWGSMAETVNDNIKKGTPLLVIGKLQTRKWQDKEGMTKYTTEIVSQNIQFLSRKQETAEDQEEMDIDEPQEDLPF